MLRMRISTRIAITASLVVLMHQSPVVAADQSTAQGAAAAEREVTQGALRIIQKDGEIQKDGKIVQCPLKHTDVNAVVSGFIARVNVTQTFHNPTEEVIEAVYVFPLPHQSAVDSMTMVIGDRKIIGLIKRREEAQQIYQQAVMQGQTAALLEQERPNIFTQKVGNIEPGQEVKIQISYVDVLQYDMGEYEFHFPMVVGPRFIPGTPVSSPVPTPTELEGQVSPPVADTDRVPDAERISPPVLRPEVRNGHDISVTLSVDAGVPVQDLSVANHTAEIVRDGERRATVKLSPQDSVPNKDFVVRYAVVGKQPEMALLAHTGEYSADARKLGGYFMLMIQPQEDERLKKSPPREMVFLVDVSGSMRGAKTAKTREMMRNMLGLCRDIDTVQVASFASRAEKLFERPLPVNEQNIKRALNFADNLRGSGGTHMLEGVKLAIDEPVDEERVRIVVMLTDGFIGNESEIIQHVGKNCGDQIRFWVIGIGQSPNMFLVDGVAKQGGGMGQRLGLGDESEPLSHEIMTRIQRAQLANVKIDWGQMQVQETYPARIPELWAGRPVILFGRYQGRGPQEVTVSGTVEGEPVQWPLSVALPEQEERHDVLARVWARKKIDDLMHRAYYADSPAIEEAVTAIALDYRLMSQYTSFVATDEKDAEKLQPRARPPRRMLVPVPLPEGAEWSGFFGGDEVSAPESVLLGNRPVSEKPMAKGLSVYRRSGRADVRFSVLGGGGFGGATFGNRLPVPAASPAPSPAGTTFFEVQREQLPHLAAGRTSFGRTRRAFGIDADGSQPAQPYTYAVLQSLAEGQSQLAQQAWGRATELRKAGGEARAVQLADELALFSDQAAANAQRSDGQIAAQALKALQDNHRRQVEDWIGKLPELSKRLDLVIRDQSVDEALQQVARAGGLPIALIPGSTDDAATALRDDVRVSYLDLQGATVAQALDWILQPLRLTWRVDQGQVRAGSVRRMDGVSAWVYDVSHIALPTPDELKELKDAGKSLAKVTQSLERFLQAARQELKTGKDDTVVWFAPGYVLVMADSQHHQRMAGLIADLTDSDRVAKLQPAAAELRAVTLQRAKQREIQSAKRAARRRTAHLANAHARFGWQLLASAADGRLDDEAFTELKIAWNDPANQQLLKGESSSLVMRSLWTISAASAALPDQRDLAQLAQTVREQTKPLLAEARKQLEQNPEDRAAFAALLYATLAHQSHGIDPAALAILTESRADALQPARLLAHALLADPKDVDTTALTQLVDDGVAGADMVALTALACRRAGQETWEVFRAAARDLLGSQPLPGHTVVMIDRLGKLGTY